MVTADRQKETKYSSLLSRKWDKRLWQLPV